jgi:protein ImuA
MKTTHNPSSITLEQLLNRGDIWRGQSQGFAPQQALETGFAGLNAALLNGGWPLGHLIELCQQNFIQSEWLLLNPALLRVGKGFLVLLNPPNMPFAQALIQSGIDLERLLIVEASNKADFLKSFTELTRANACDAVLAWQPKQFLSYTELRKCSLASSEGQGLYFLFRPASVKEQSSPAALRLLMTLHAQHLQITIFKQKGALKAHSQPILLPVPDTWQSSLPHHELDQTGSTQPDNTQPKKMVSVTRLYHAK